MILDAALDARIDVSVVEKRMQGRDHPVVLGMPETYYLKCFILRKLGRAFVSTQRREGAKDSLNSDQALPDADKHLVGAGFQIGVLERKHLVREADFVE